jgi:hypothetical protein
MHMAISQKPEPQAAPKSAAKRNVRSFTYTFAKGWENTPMHGKSVTWDVPNDFETAITPEFFSNADILREIAIKQLNIFRGHAMKTRFMAKGTPDVDKTLDALQTYARGKAYKTAPSQKVKGGARKAEKEAAQREAARQNAALAKIQSYDEATLKTLQELNVYTPEQVKAELTRRAGK